MQINTKTITENGHYLVKILALLALANLFLYALFSFATTIRLANSTLLKNGNYIALKALMANEVKPKLDDMLLQCSTTSLTNNLRLNACKEKSSNTILQIMDEKYEEK